MNWQLSVEKLLGLLATESTRGSYDGVITGIADLRTAGEGELSFLGARKFAKYLPEAKASVVLVAPDQEGEPNEGQLWIPVESPTVALAMICRHLETILAPRP